jgi:hypothetical protein
LLRGEDPHPQHRALFGRIVTDEHDTFGLLEVLERARRAIGTEGFHQGRCRRRRAQPRVRIDRGDAQSDSRDLPERVVLLEQQLTAVVDPDGVRSVGRECLIELVHDELHGLVPGGTDELPRTIAYQWMRRTAGMAIREVLIEPLRPQAPVVDWMALLAANPHNLSVGHGDVHATSDRTDPAGGWHPLVNLCGDVLLGEVPRCHVDHRSKRAAGSLLLS